MSLSMMSPDGWLWRATKRKCGWRCRSFWWWRLLSGHAAGDEYVGGPRVCWWCSRFILHLIQCFIPPLQFFFVCLFLIFYVFICLFSQLFPIVDRKAATGDDQDPIAMGRHWLEMNALRAKVKKEVDTRASKGVSIFKPWGDREKDFKNRFIMKCGILRFRK